MASSARKSVIRLYWTDKCVEFLAYVDLPSPSINLTVGNTLASAMHAKRSADTSWNLGPPEV